MSTMKTTWVTFNCNSFVRFKPTEAGLRALNNSADKVFFSNVGDGVWKTPLWVFMQFFGPHLFHGEDFPFDPDVQIAWEEQK